MKNQSIILIFILSLFTLRSVAQCTATISGGSSPICYNTSPGTLTATGTGDPGPYTYLWYQDAVSTGVTTQTFTPGNLTATSSFYCSITSATCGTLNSSPITITVTPNVGTPTSITVSAGSEPTCQLTNGSTTTTYSTTASNSTGFNWSINNGSAGSIDASSGLMKWSNGFSGSVDIQVTASGCGGPSPQVIRSVFVTPAVGNPSTPSPSATTICEGSANTSYTTSATNATSYTWSVTGTGNTISGTGTTGTVTWAAGYSGTATVSVTANGCGTSSPASTTVTVTPTVGTPSTPAPSATTICEGSANTSYTTSATNATSYTWSVTGTGNTISGTGTTGTVTWAAGYSGTATVSVIANGCGTSSPASTTVTVTPTVGTPSTPSPSATTICEGSANTSYTTSATNATSYTWSVTGTGNSISGTGTTGTVTWAAGYSGTATVSVIAHGCGTSSPATTTVTVTPAVGTPSTPSPSATTICEGSANTSYTTSTTNATSYTWSVTGTGNTISGTGTTGTVTWAAGFSGTATVSVIANGCGTSSPASTTVTVTPTVGTPSTPSPSATTICEGSANTSYTTSATNATSYSWSVTGTGNTISGTGTTGTVTWAAGYSGTATVSVIANGCGTSSPASTTVTVTPAVGIPSTPAPSATTICEGSANTSYTTSAANATSYTWSVTGTGNTISGTGTTGTVTWAAGYSGTATVSVIANGCGTSSPASTTVTVTPTVGTPSTPSPSATTICEGSANTSYTTSATNATSYTWSVTGTGNTISGTGTTGTVTWAAGYSGTATVSVIANGCGTSSPASTTVTVTPTVGTPSTPSPSATTICEGSANTSYTTSATNATSYTWSVTGTGNTISGTGTTGTVTWAAGYSGTATVSVIANGCGTSSPASTTVTVTPTVGTPSTPSPSATTICEGSANTSYTTAATNATSYTWSVTGTGNTISGTGTTGTVTWAAGYSGTATVSVIANGCGTSSPASTTVTVTPTVGTPSTPSPSATTICEGSANTSYTTSATNATSYTWSVTGTGNSISGTGTTGTVTWAAGYSGTATVSVIAHGCGTPSPATTTVTVTPAVGTPSTPSPSATTICEGSANTSYTTSATNATSYTWSVTGTGNTISGTGTTGTVTWAAGYSGTATVSVIANGCGTSIPASTTVTVDPSPSANAGPALTAICQGLTSSALNGSVGGSATGGTWSTTAGGTFNPNPTTLNATWSPPSGYSGSATLTLTTTGGSCGTTSASKVQVVNPNASLSLTSAAGSNLQSVCINTSIVSIVYIVAGGGTGAVVTGLPAGLTGVYSAGTFTISGSPTASGTFNYTVTTSGTCTQATANGTINVNPVASILLTSGAGSNLQTLCVNSVISNITYSISGGGTGAGVTGLPAGVAGTFSSGVFTISGAPTSAGTFNYTVTTTGTCTQTTATGTLTVNSLPVPTLVSSDADNIICLGTNVTFTAGGGTNYNFRLGGASVQDGTASTYTTSSLINGQIVDVIVTTANGCKATSAAITNFVNPLPFIFVTTPPTCSADLTTYSLAVVVSSGTVTSTSGTVTDNGGNVWTISGVLSGVNVSVKVVDGNGCEKILAVTAPNCSCPVIIAPTSGGDKSYCASGIIPTISATVLSGETVDWYNSSSGGTLLKSGSLTYTPSSAGTYYALTRNTTTGCISSTRTAIVVTMNPLPLPTLVSSDADNIFCAGTGITFTAGGGTNYNFRLGGVSIQNGTSGTYTTSTLTNGQVVDVVVTNSFGCIATSTGITNTVNPLPTPTLTSSDADNIFCAGTNVVFTAGGGISFNFKVDGVGVQSGLLNTLTTGSLTNGQVVSVTVTNSNGCLATSSGIANTVSAIPVPTLTSSDADNVFCAGTSVTFTASGGSVYNFRVGGATVQNSTSTTYITGSLINGQTVDVIVTNPAGCSATSTGITNVVNPIPVANAGAGGNECDLNFIFSAVSGPGVGNWSKISGPGTATFAPNSNSPTATVTVSEYGTYTFSWTEVNNSCSNSSSVTVNFYKQPVSNPGTGGNNCGQDFFLKAVPSVGTGTWTKSAGTGTVTFSPDANTPNAKVSVTEYGQYTFKWTEVNGTCSNSGSVNVMFIESSVADAGSGGEVCALDFSLNAKQGTSIGTWTKFSGPGNAVFIPDNHRSNATVKVDLAGAYVFAWTEVNSTCQSVDTVKVVFRDLPAVYAGRDTIICKGKTVPLQATGTGSFAWIPDTLVSDPNISNPVALTDTTTIFKVILTDQFGCKNSDSLTVEVKDKPIADAGKQQTLDYVFETTLDAQLPSGINTGTWSVLTGSGEFTDNTYAGTFVDKLSVGKNKFLWTVTNEYCSASIDTAVVMVNDLLIPTLITPNMDGKNDYFVLRGLTTLGKTELTIFDRRGLQVFKNINYDNLWNGVDYNDKPLPDDTYFYVIRAANGKSISGYIVIRR
jgi:gliding motility-associated-like protein